VSAARRSHDEGGIPIGAALLDADGVVLGDGHNQRVQRKSMLRHAEIDCLEEVGRRSTFAGTTLYSTLMPCYMCAGAVIQFGIPRVVVGESRTFRGARDLLVRHGVELIDVDDPVCVSLLGAFVAAHPAVWSEDTGSG